MKRITLTPPADTVELNNLQGDEIVAYKTTEGKSYAILHKLQDGRWGFINLCYPTGGPVFVAENFFASCKLAAANQQRKLYTFNNAKELITAMYEDKM